MIANCHCGVVLRHLTIGKVTMTTTAEPAMTGILASDAETAETAENEGDLQEEQCNIMCN